MLSPYYNIEPPPSNFTGCPLGGNPKVASQFGFPACGTAIPGGSGLASLKGGRKSRRGGRKSRRGGEESAGEQAVQPSGESAAQAHNGSAASAVVNHQVRCPPGCVKPNFFNKLFGKSGGRKSRRRRKAHKSRKSHKARKSHKSRKSRKSRH